MFLSRTTNLLTALTLAVVTLVFSPHYAAAQEGVVSLVSSVDFPGKRVTDVTAYVDVFTQTEYAIVGHSGGGSGIAIVDLSDPENPQVVSTLDGIPGFDVKVFDTYAYTVNGGDSGTGSIVDISNPLAPVRVAGFPSSHNIFVDHKGYMFASVSGLTVYDLNSNPVAPDSVWFDQMGGGHDASVIGDTLYDFHGFEGTFIYDVTDRSNPVEIGHIDPPFVTYHHSGWVTEDRNFLFINDELSSHPSADVTIWDISDVEDPQFVNSISDANATVHNLHIINNFAFFSYYSAGFKVFDITNPAEPLEIGSFDTDPIGTAGFSGAFGVDAFLPSGLVLVSGQSGTDPGKLHVFSVDGFTPVGVDDVDPKPSQPLTVDSYPNPFTASTVLEFEALGPSTVSIYDVTGREVFSRDLAASSGLMRVSWSAENLSAGVYFARITSGGTSTTKSLTIAR